MPDAAVRTGFFRIPLEQLRENTVLGFDLYIQHPGQEPVLFRARDLPFTDDHRCRLAESGSTALLVPDEQRAAYENYIGQEERPPERPAGVPVDEIERRLDTALDRTRPLARRCRVVLDTSCELVQHAFADPVTPGLPQSLHSLAKTTGRLLLAEDEALARLIAMFRLDSDAITHSTNTAVFTVGLAQAAGVDDPDELGAIGRAALVHDIGRAAAASGDGTVAVDRSLEETREHPDKGAEILEQAGWDDLLCLEVCRSHHERFDGSGFPRGLEGEKIHPVARMVAIADVYDQLTSAGPGRPPHSGFQALWKMSQEMRGQFDPRLLELFIRMLLAGRA